MKWTKARNTFATTPSYNFVPTESNTLRGNFCKLPAAPTGISGPSEVCVNQGVVGFTVQQVNDADHYTWHYSGTGVTPYYIIATPPPVIYNYDGDYQSAFGEDVDMSWEVAARYPASMISASAGSKIRNIQVYIGDLANTFKLRIYGQGTDSTPGAILVEQDFYPIPNSWNTIYLNTPFILTASDLWVGYWMDQSANVFIAGADAGPANINGCFLKENGEWNRLTDFGFSRNWNIRVTINYEDNSSSAWTFGPNATSGILTVHPVNSCGFGTPFTKAITVTPCATTQVIPCPAGYTWFSLNKNRGMWNINYVLGPLTYMGGLTHTPAQNDRIISQTQFATYYGSSWVGSLTTIDPNQMYIANFASADTIVVRGVPVPPGPVNLGQGYTWFGYLPQCNENINSALAGISPLPANDDRIIAQNSFSVYNVNTWVGSVQTMEPNKGYKSRLTNTGVFTYPSCSKSVISVCEDLEIADAEWESAANMMYTMNIIGEVKTSDGVSLTGKNLQFGSFCSTQCRGITTQPDCMEGYFFVSVASNEATGEVIHFKVKVGEQVYDIVEKLPFTEGQCLGTIDNPVIFTLPANVSLPGSPDAFFLGNAVPNPFTHETTIPYNLPEEAAVQLSIYSVTGQLLKRIDAGIQPAGGHTIKLAALREGAGVYFYALEARTQQQLNRGVKRLVQLQ